MDIAKFSKMLSDKHFTDLKRLEYKYSKDEVKEFLELLKQNSFTKLPICDFKGENLVFLETSAGINFSALKLLIKDQPQKYGLKAMQEEVYSTAKIEDIDFSRNSIRNIFNGLAPKDEQEDRIMGLKKGLEFIADTDNKITEDNIFKLYKMTIGDFLDDENKLENGNFYRHDSVFVASTKIEHSGLQHTLLPEYMKKFVAYINADDNSNDLIKACIIHFYFAYLHPYFDGNGRMSRLLHMWFLVQKGFSSTLFVPFSSYIERSRKAYYDAFTKIEDNYNISGLIDVTPFVLYFILNVYNKLEPETAQIQIFDLFHEALNDGVVTKKEENLFNFVLSAYGIDGFTTKQLERDYGNAAYATIRSFVLKFEKLNLLKSQKYSNKSVYKINLGE